MYGVKIFKRLLSRLQETCFLLNLILYEAVAEVILLTSKQYLHFLF